MADDKTSMSEGYTAIRFQPGSIRQEVWKRMESGPERPWHLKDFADLPAAGVNQALSRLCRVGVIVRMQWGVYYQPRLTVPGPNQPDLVRIRRLAARGRRVFLSGMAAANILGFTTRMPARLDLVTNGDNFPRLFENGRIMLHRRRPVTWRYLTETDGALLEFMRDGGKFSALSPEETAAKLIEHCREPGRYERLLKVIKTEPQRVRAMLGAIGEQLGQPDHVLDRIADKLPRFPRYHFGILAALPCAKRWMAEVK
jgi:uncharacterized protein DUF6088